MKKQDSAHVLILFSLFSVVIYVGGESTNSFGFGSDDIFTMLTTDFGIIFMVQDVHNG